MWSTTPQNQLDPPEDTETCCSTAGQCPNFPLKTNSIHQRILKRVVTTSTPRCSVSLKTNSIHQRILKLGRLWRAGAADDPQNQLDPPEDTETRQQLRRRVPIVRPQNQLDPPEDTETSPGTPPHPTSPSPLKTNSIHQRILKQRLETLAELLHRPSKPTRSTRGY